jgi:23S rRNA pseudouridine2605 synthase
MIMDGRVIVDGQTAIPGQRVDPGRAEVLVDRVPLPVDPALVYYLLHKPFGVISTTDDPHGRTPVVDLVPPLPKVYPVGRLDADSTGLLLLTNDGSFANLIAHPSSGITKTYEVLVRGNPSRADMSRLRHGIELEDGPAVPVAVRRIGAAAGRSHLELTMAEGRNREVRRLCAAAGYQVIRLHRVAIGALRDRTLKPGEWRNLEVTEIRAFHRARKDREVHHGETPR